MKPFTTFAPEPMSTFSGDYLIACGANFSSPAFLDVYCPCPEFLNGDLSMPEPTQHYFAGGGGGTVHAWFLPPLPMPTAASEKLHQFSSM